MDLRDKSYPVFSMFNDRWALATAGTLDDYDTMTIGWGGMGTIRGPPHAGKPVLTIYVSPARYTHGYLERCELFTVSFFPEAYRKDLLLLGSRSGRD
ncbi:MAG: flavin reductase, partial [Oscillospiraceae bacterium]|nr:flavin reductase [Oscillospiraceae bacterium]